MQDKELRGQPVAQKITEEVKRQVETMKEKGVLPTLSMIRVGDRIEDMAYERSAQRRMELCGIRTQSEVLKNDITTQRLIDVIEKNNKAKEVHGILLFQPLPPHIDVEAIKRAIEPIKDVDCNNPLSSAKMYLDDKKALIPATPGAVIEILHHYDIALEGTNVVVLGRSMIVGKPMAMMLLNKNATVTICHSKTKNLSELCKSADILVSCIGKAKFVTKEYVNPQSIVIDVGVNLDKNNKLCGDVDYADVAPAVHAITPVPGGVGAVTTSVLAQNLLKAFSMQNR